MKGIALKIITILLAIVVAFFCIISFFSLFYLAATIIGIYSEGANWFNVSYLTGQLITLIFSVILIYVLGKQLKKLEWR